MGTIITSRFTGSIVAATILSCSTLLYAGDQAPGQQTAPATAASATAPISKTVVETPATKADQTEVIARVNGVEIKAIDMRRARKVMLSSQRGVTLTPEQMKEVDSQAVSQLVSAELLYQAAVKVEIKDLDKLVEEKMAQGRKRFASDKDFEKAIKDLEMDDKSLVYYTRRDLVISNFVENRLAPKVIVTEADTRKFYDQNPDKFSRSALVRASHILIGADASASADDKKKAREKAEKIRKELVEGADFEKLAKADSTCPSSQQGGDLGYFGKGQMVEPFEKAAFILKKGELSPVVETQFGYHIIKVTEKKEPETVEYKDASKRIEEYLKGQKRNAAIGEFLADARKTAKIEILTK